jgi:uncharacterized delta-60 repeat protein
LLAPQGVLQRLTPSGELDRSFGVGGVATLDDALRVGYSVDNFALDSAGRVLVAGSSDRALAIERFTADGEPDPSFDGDGVAVASPVEASSLQSPRSLQWGELLAIRPDDRPLVVGEALLDSGDAEVVAAQFRADGTLDPSFADDGMSRIPVTVPASSVPQNPNYYAARAIALDADGSAVLRLELQRAVPGLYDFCPGASVLRLNADGTLDEGFGANHGLTPLVSGCASDLALLNTGGFLAVGTLIGRDLPSQLVQTAYTGAGAPEPGFRPRGSMVAGFSSWATSIEQLPGGMLITVGAAGIDTCVTPGFIQCRFGFLLAQRPDGTVVDDFGTHGVATLPRERICPDPFERCPYPVRREFRRLVRDSVSRQTHLVGRSLRTDVACDQVVAEPCRVKARFTTRWSGRTLAKVRRVSIADGAVQRVRSRRLGRAAMSALADLTHLEMQVVFAAEHQQPVRFEQRVKLPKRPAERPADRLAR